MTDRGHSLSQLLFTSPPVVLDGGLATELEAQGHDLSDDRWSARLLQDDPDAIVAAHRAFAQAGARVLITASYQAAEPEDVRRSVELARRAARTVADPPLVAASLGPYGALLADGQEYTGDYPPGVDLAAVHRPRMAALVAARPDAIACETIPRADEAGVLARLLDETDAPEAWIAFQCRDGERTGHGEPIEAAVAAATSSPRVVAVGVNCTRPEHVAPLLARMRTVTDLPLVAYPNAGRVWDGPARSWRTDAPESFSPGFATALVSAGAALVGGCCGISPDGIASLAGELRQ